jgi:hypothetical protein
MRVVPVAGGYGTRFAEIEDDKTVWEKEPMANLAKDDQLSVLFSQRILASDGYPARQAIPRGVVGGGTRSLEDLVAREVPS